jgi:bifunctional ADP-heptose synthase (sugar kinase/adenylyltransferase)
MAKTDRMPGPKIRELDDPAVHLADLRARGQRIVHCHGVFDLLHLGVEDVPDRMALVSVA